MRFGGRVGRVECLGVGLVWPSVWSGRGDLGRLSGDPGSSSRAQELGPAFGVRRSVLRAVVRGSCRSSGELSAGQGGG